MSWLLFRHHVMWGHPHLVPLCKVTPPPPLRGWLFLISYLVRLALQRSMRGDCGLWSLLPPGVGAWPAWGSALLGEDPMLTGWENWEDTDRWGE